MALDGSSDAGIGFKAMLQRRQVLWRARSEITDPALRTEYDTLAHLNGKLRAYDWVRARGHVTPNYWLYPNIAAALEATKLDRFVVKPVVGHSSKGVFLLTRKESGRGLLTLFRRGGGYDCAMTGCHYASNAAVIRRYAKFMGDQTSPAALEVIVEELVEDAQGWDVPLDYKVHAFAAGSPLVLQRYGPNSQGKAGKGYEWYDEAGTHLGDICEEGPHNPRWKMVPPPSLPEIFRIARELVAAAGVSFVRVDLYNSTRGVVFGEFTPVPNSAKLTFDPIWDRRLGQVWARSLEQLGLDYWDAAALSSHGGAEVRSAS